MQYLGAMHLPMLAENSVFLCSFAYNVATGKISIEETAHSTVREQLKAICMLALRIEPRCAPVYNWLGATMRTRGETITLPNDRKLDRKGLYLEALRHQDHAVYYCNLASCLIADRAHSPPGHGYWAIVQLPDGRFVGPQELCIEALKCDVNFGRAYVCLTTALALQHVPVHDAFAVVNGRVLGREGLCIEALRCDASLAHPYRTLGTLLAPEETATLADGRIMRNYELLLEAARCTQADDTSAAARCVNSARQILEFQRPELLQSWTRRGHLLFGAQTNALFAMLLLGLQRLETTGAVGLAHQAMLEDMLECWQAGDASKLKVGLLSPGSWQPHRHLEPKPIEHCGALLAGAVGVSQTQAPPNPFHSWTTSQSPFGLFGVTSHHVRASMSIFHSEFYHLFERLRLLSLEATYDEPAVPVPAWAHLALVDDRPTRQTRSRTRGQWYSRLGFPARFPASPARIQRRSGTLHQPTPRR